jgi:Cft2 family RNA processing exonuclease
MWHTSRFLRCWHSDRIETSHQHVYIRAHVAALEQFSDHADTDELLLCLGTFRKKPQVTYLVHRMRPNFCGKRFLRT